MSAEELNSKSPESNSPEKELSRESLEQREKIGEQLEKNAEKSNIENGEQVEAKARHEALENALSVESGSAEKKGKESGAPAKRRHGAPSKKETSAAYKRTMKTVRDEMPAVQRGFSKFIHNPVVEKVSEVAGKTIARPNAILGAGIFAVIAVGAVYLIARHFGYPLSGFETIAALIAGWVVGMLYDLFKGMLTGKRT